MRHKKVGEVDLEEPHLRNKEVGGQWTEVPEVPPLVAVGGY